MADFDIVTVDVLSASFQTQQLGEGMLSYQLAQDGGLVAPCGASIAYHGLLHRSTSPLPVEASVGWRLPRGSIGIRTG
jgi:hypothetical protein